MAGTAGVLTRKAMGSTLSKWERADPANRVTESRLRSIRVLCVSTPLVATLLRDKAGSLVSVHTVILACSLDAVTQGQLAACFARLPSVRTVKFEDWSPAADLIAGVLRTSSLRMLSLVRVGMGKDSAAALVAGLRRPDSSEKLVLRCEELKLPQAVQLTHISGAASAAGVHCEIVNVADTVRRM